MAEFYYAHVSARKGTAQSDLEKTMNLAIDWFRITDNDWILYTSSDAKKWYSRLSKHVKPGGKLLLLKLDMSDYFGFMTPKLWDWIRKRNK